MTRSTLLEWCNFSRFCRETLDELYARYNRREFIHPDPLEFLHQYTGALDREVVGMLASSLAYGRVQQILKSVSKVLEVMGDSPSLFLREHSLAGLQEVYGNFRHRFTGGDQLAGLLFGVRQVIQEYGSLEACFLGHGGHDDETVLPALAAFVGELRAKIPCDMNVLLPALENGSACKRLNLFLRWMIRADEVDPGVWRGADPRLLIVPLDTHMHRIALKARLTSRRQANMQTAVEITRAFRRIVPEDPVRYDFALTRPGIRGIENG